MQRNSSNAAPAANPQAAPASPGLRVCHVVKHCRVGNGNANVAVDLACAQAAANQAVSFASGGGDFAGLLQQHGVTLFDVPHGHLSLTGNAAAVARLRAHFKAFRPDVIHAHMVASALLAWVAARGLGIPLVVTVHNSFDRQSILMRIADRVVAVSIAEYNALVQRGFRNDTLSAVVNGTEGSPREAFLAADKPIALKRPCVVTACGLHHRKGTGIVMAGFIAAARDKPDWNFYILGDGPERASLERQARDSGIGERIHLLGFCNQPGAVFEQAEIFTIGSYAEPFGLVLSEARRAGCALIATNVGGIPEVLEFGRAGRLVPPGNAAAFARELSALMIDPGLLAAARAAAREGHTFFNLDRVRQDYESVYETTIARAAPTLRAASRQNPPIEQSSSPIAQPR